MARSGNTFPGLLVPDEPAKVVISVKCWNHTFCRCLDFSIDLRRGSTSRRNPYRSPEVVGSVEPAQHGNTPALAQHVSFQIVMLVMMYGRLQCRRLENSKLRCLRGVSGASGGKVNGDRGHDAASSGPSTSFSAEPQQLPWRSHRWRNPRTNGWSKLRIRQSPYDLPKSQDLSSQQNIRVKARVSPCESRIRFL
jgi:hypothetical protein